MPTPRLRPGHPTWELAVQSYRRVQSGERVGDVAADLDKDWSVVKNWIDKVRLYESASPGQVAAAEATGLDLSGAKHGWIKVPPKDGNPGYSTFWRADRQDPEDMLETIRAGVASIPAVCATPSPEHSDSELLTLIPVADLHAGMMAWGDETGEDYDTRKATDRLKQWVADVVFRSPESGIGVILFNGDTLHANDQTNATPKSKHTLDVDTRQFRTIEMLLHAIGVAMDTALMRFREVHLVVKPGNHDRDAYLAILFAMVERYRNEPRVKIEREPSEFWAFHFGRVMLASHHGDKGKAQQMVLFLADQYPEIWGQTRFRFLWTGHVHHHKSQDIGGVTWEQSRATTARDAYAVSRGYTSRSELQAVTYHREKGEVSRVRVMA